jgi:hypothetical protein
MSVMVPPSGIGQPIRIVLSALSRLGRLIVGQ